MKGVIWLASGLLLALLLVSGVSVGSQLSLPSNFFPVQDLKSIGQISSQALGKINNSLNSQVSVLNNSAAVISTWDTITGWFYPLTSWLKDLWSRFINAWKNFLGLTPKETPTAVSPELREQIKQELLAELKSQGLINIDVSAGGVSGTKYGVMVFPSTGEVSRDEAIKKSLSQMFADQVDLKFDQTGVSGVVTPTFRDGRKGGNYIFVLTPLR